MSAEFLVTIGDVSNLEGAFHGKFLKGRGEPRIAMVGRSNVGKSSLINALVGTTVAQVSNDPGKTRSIHFYSWKEGAKIIADLPGYGYARSAKSERERWSSFINAYLREDLNLLGVLLLLDSRHGPTDLDREAIGFLAGLGISVLVVMTKFDQLKTQSERAARKKEVTSALTELGLSGREPFWVSAKSKAGLKELAAELSRR